MRGGRTGASLARQAERQSSSFRREASVGNALVVYESGYRNTRAIAQAVAGAAEAGE